MTGISLGLVGASFLGALATCMVVIPRRRMNRRAEAILGQMPDREEKTVYLRFDSAWPSAKQNAMKSRIAEVEAEGWTYLKAGEAAVSRIFRSWGGGLDLHFVRAKQGN